MHSNRPVKPAPSRLSSLLPSLWDWRTDLGALGNLLLLSVMAAGGEWLAHQLIYVLRYGSQFSTVMQTTPHWLYMGPLGVLFALLTFLSLVLSCLTFLHSRGATSRLIHRLPHRVRSFVPDVRYGVPLSGLAGTASVLAAYQAILFVAQENAEAIVQGYGWQGLSVLLSWNHLAVLPIHGIVALCGAVILWTLVTWTRCSRRTLEAVRALVRLFASPRPAPLRLRVVRTWIPNLRLTAGSLSLRSPPLRV